MSCARLDGHADDLHVNSTDLYHVNLEQSLSIETCNLYIVMKRQTAVTS